MKKDQDIFDRIMRLKFLNRFWPIYKKYKEILLYLFFGGLTFLVSVGSYIFFEFIIHMPPLITNLFSWILAVTFAYVTNRVWVFTDIAYGVWGITKEIIFFFTGRAATLILEEAILFIGITVLEFNSLSVKVIGQIIVIITNYFISKIIVFKTGK